VKGLKLEGTPWCALPAGPGGCFGWPPHALHRLIHSVSKRVAQVWLARSAGMASRRSYGSARKSVYLPYMCYACQVGLEKIGSRSFQVVSWSLARLAKMFCAQRHAQPNCGWPPRAPARYLAPEAACGRGLLPATDVWAADTGVGPSMASGSQVCAGVMAHQLLTGDFPFIDRISPNRPDVARVLRRGPLFPPRLLPSPRALAQRARGRAAGGYGPASRAALQQRLVRCCLPLCCSARPSASAPRSCSLPQTWIRTASV